MAELEEDNISGQEVHDAVEKELPDVSAESLEAEAAADVKIIEDNEARLESSGAIDAEVLAEGRSILSEAKSSEELLEFELQQEKVDEGMLAAYAEYDSRGPMVGETIIKDELGRDIKAEVRVGSGNKDKEVRFTVWDPSKNGYIGFTLLRAVDKEDVAALSPHAPMSAYGDEGVNPGCIYVDAMETDGRKGRYAGVGKALHQVTVERSFQEGFEGRVQERVGGVDTDNPFAGWFETPGTSAGFHESFGFHGQDVYNEDGSLHHAGQEIHEKLARAAWEEAERIKEKTGEPPREVVKPRTEFYAEDRAWMYLPKEVRDREWQRMRQSPVLKANRATTEALLRKHDDLLAEHFARLKEKEEAEAGASMAEAYKRVAEDYSGKGIDPSGFYEAAAERYLSEKEGMEGEAFAAAMYQRAGNEERAREMWRKALESAKDAGGEEVLRSLPHGYDEDWKYTEKAKKGSLRVEEDTDLI